jgi:hypothetical protein
MQTDRALHLENPATSQASRPGTGVRSTMAMHITADILESFLQCQYKSYLQLLGEQGVLGDRVAGVPGVIESLRYL